MNERDSASRRGGLSVSRISGLLADFSAEVIFILLAGIVLNVSGSPAFAQQATPRTGLLYNTTETSALKYECSQQKDGILACEFLQTRISLKKRPEQWESYRAEALGEWRAGRNKPQENECKMYSQLSAAFENGVAPDGVNKEQFARSMSQIGALQKNEMITVARAFAKVCSAPTERNYESLLRTFFENETRTCTVGSSKFQQTFRYTSNGNWASNEGPNGDCGTIVISSFEQDRTNKYGFFFYKTRKIITNKSGSMSGIMPCSGLDENEYAYQWQSKEVYQECSKLEFSPI